MRVMSSGLCKELEGAVFPFQVESLEDGVDDAVHAGHVDEPDQGPGSSSYFHETAFHHIGGRTFFQRCRGKAKNDSSSGRSRSRRRSMGPYSRDQRARKRRKAACAWLRLSAL